jgi:hypothetical protein
MGCYPDFKLEKEKILLQKTVVNVTLHYYYIYKRKKFFFKQRSKIRDTSLLRAVGVEEQNIQSTIFNDFNIPSSFSYPFNKQTVRAIFKRLTLRLFKNYS